jgi:hypothetical protein
MQVAIACLFHRCQYFSQEMLNELIETLRPSSLQHALTDFQDISSLVLKLQQTIAESHIKLAILFLNKTNQGRDYVRNVANRRAKKLKILDVDYKVLAAAMPFERTLIRILWFPLRAVACDEAWKDVDEKPANEYQGQAQAFPGTEEVKRFRQWTIEYVAALSRILSTHNTQPELSVHAQINIFRQLSKPRFGQSIQWPTFDFSERRIRQIQDGNYINASTRDSIESFLEDLEQRLEKRLIPDDAANADDDGNLDAFKPITVDARPITLGSEYQETGGEGMHGTSSMEAVYDCNLNATQKLKAVLEGGLCELTERTDSERGEIPEELIDVATLGPQALVRYAALQMEREGNIIMRIICELDNILAKNKKERDGLAAQLRRQRQLREQMKELESIVCKEQAGKETDTKELEDLLAVNNRTSGTVPNRSGGGSWLDRVGNHNRTKLEHSPLNTLGWETETPIQKVDISRGKQADSKSNSVLPQHSSQKQHSSPTPQSATSESHRLTIDTSPSSPKGPSQESQMSSQLSSPADSHDGEPSQNDGQFADNDNNSEDSDVCSDGRT